MIFPVKNGRITTKYSAWHRALDVAPKVRGDRNTPLLAPEAGKLLYKGYDRRNGHWLGMQGKRGYHFFAHLKASTTLKYGASIKEGQTLATLGTTGFSTGIHTHWVVYEPNRSEGKKVDPWAFLLKWKTPPVSVKYYIVKRGDTVTGISKKHGISFKTFRQLNPQIRNYNLIYVGQKVRVR